MLNQILCEGITNNQAAFRTQTMEHLYLATVTKGALSDAPVHLDFTKKTLPKQQHIEHPRNEPLYRSFWLPENNLGVLKSLKNEISDEDLDIALGVSIAASNVSDKYLDTVRSWDISVDRCIVRFSARFHAMWFRRQESTIWFCVVDGEFVVFALTPGESTSTNLSICDKQIPQICVPKDGLRWMQLQNELVDRFENDGHVRAMSAAIMLSCNPQGEFEGVANSILPALLRNLECNLYYDSPMDEDMMTVLADPKTSGEKDLIFDCGGGHSAVSTLNESMGKLKRVSKPKNLFKFIESSAMLMPFAFV